MATFKSFVELTLFIAVLNQIHAYSYDAYEKERLRVNVKEDELIKEQQLSREGEQSSEFWLDLGKQYVRQQKQQKQNKNVAKNIIMFVGSGMGVSTLVAARSYIGAEHTKLSFEEFPYVGLSKTYSVDKMVSDSGATATANLCGVKANVGTVGVNGAVFRNDCQAMKNSSNHVNSIAQWAMEGGKYAGFVTTTRLTHASVAAVYAHTANKDWESDTKLAQACGADNELHDVAYQLIHGAVGSKLKVMMGGGKNAFVGDVGWRSDGRNLIEDYRNHSLRNVFVETKEQLEEVNLNQTERLLGIFGDNELEYHLKAAAKSESTQPRLKDMTKKAIEFMQRKENGQGYFLLIEGGGIDRAHKDNKARLALDETRAFSEAVELARRITSEKDTLIVVTSDHSSTFSVAGYQNRGSDIFSVIKNAKDGFSYEPLSYANGKGYRKHFDAKASKRISPEEVLRGDADDLFPATVPLASSTNGGEDVPVFALGPWSHLFTGVYEQNAIPHMMAYAACIGQGLKACDVL